MSIDGHATISVCSPPPCGEGLGVGVLQQITARPPPRRFALTLPTRGRVGSEFTARAESISTEYVLAPAAAQGVSDLASYSAAWRRAPPTPRASSATRLITAVTGFAVGLSSRSRLPLSAFTSAEPTTTPSAEDAIAAPFSALRTPKPTATG